MLDALAVNVAGFADVVDAILPVSIYFASVAPLLNMSSEV
jgi:hypothetical protein